VGSAGLYLEDYFEEQLKLVYPDTVFPGGREEQMIPPLEDEIEEEEEQPLEPNGAIAEDSKPQSPAGKGSPTVDEETVPKEEPVAPAESKNLDNGKTETSQNETDEVNTNIEAGIPPAQEEKQDESADMKQVGNCPTADTEVKDDSEDKKAQPPTDNSEDTPETSGNPAPAEAPSEPEG
ncbi:hypothetical protein XENOCAPTIV_001202, partial [Xenoophorus captivus]